MGVIEAIGASERLCRRGDLSGAARVLEPYAGDRAVDLQRGAVAAEGVLLDGLDPTEVESILRPHLVEGRALDLIGLAHFHAAVTSGAHSLGEAVGECTAASRLTFDAPCWQAANTLHIGMTQQALGAHDIAEMYLGDAYRSTPECPAERAFAAFHLGLDALARDGSESGVELIEEALDVRRSNSLDARVPETLVALADAIGESQPERAIKLADEAVERSKELQVRRPLAVALGATGRLHGEKRDLAEGMDIAGRLGDRALKAALERMIEALEED